MSKRKILSKAVCYFRIIAFLLLLAQAILMMFDAENLCYRFFVLIFLIFFIVMSDLLDSYLDYSSLKLDKTRKKHIWTGFILEIVYWLLIASLVLDSILKFATFDISIIISLGIIISAFVSDIFTTLAGSKSTHIFKMFICITYSMYIAILCLTNV